MGRLLHDLLALFQPLQGTHTVHLRGGPGARFVIGWVIYRRNVIATLVLLCLVRGGGEVVDPLPCHRTQSAPHLAHSRHLPPRHITAAPLGQAQAAATIALPCLTPEQMQRLITFLESSLSGTDSLITTDANCFVAFSHDICVLQDRTLKSPIGLGKKGWRVYDLETNQVFFSRDVKFEEIVFPFTTPLGPFPTPETITFCPARDCSEHPMASPPVIGGDTPPATGGDPPPSPVATPSPGPPGITAGPDPEISSPTSPPSSPTAPSPTLGRGKRQKKAPSVLKDYSPRNWFAKLSTALRSYGFLQSNADHTLFTYWKGDVFLSVLVYVDDLILAGNNSTACSSFKQYLNDCFKLKDLGPLNLLVPNIGTPRFGFYDISKPPRAKACFCRPIVLFRSMPFVTRIAHSPGVSLPDILFPWEIPSFHGVPRNSRQFLDHPLRQNTVRWRLELPAGSIGDKRQVRSLAQNGIHQAVDKAHHEEHEDRVVAHHHQLEPDPCPTRVQDPLHQQRHHQQHVQHQRLHRVEPHVPAQTRVPDHAQIQGEEGHEAGVRQGPEEAAVLEAVEEGEEVGGGGYEAVGDGGGVVGGGDGAGAGALEVMERGDVEG
ncbi:hypothetical protein RJ640_016786 [Escallonia rubra]|uniref:Reverse transcriptase Ty1/copia-type domain-containing protein n=1 Tax=Escallonia rubra TaxID=112253 RepID=A0AA88U6T7_9ASTE|nr:hypothetical protein RJ640_016786 [Escallonia rubra]